MSSNTKDTEAIAEKAMVWFTIGMTLAALVLGIILGSRS